MNGHELVLTQDEAVDLIVGIADGTFGLQEIEAWLRVEPHDRDAL